MKLVAASLFLSLISLCPAWGQSYTLTDLGLPPGYTNSSAKAINAKNEVTGELNRGTACSHAFLYRTGQITDLGTLPGCADSVGNAINNDARIAGGATSSAQAAHAFRAHQGTLEEVAVPGSLTSVSSAINSAGQIVGDAVTSSGEAHAFLADGGHVTFLDNLVKGKSDWKLQEANGINDKSDVVGSGLIGGAKHAFLLHDGTVTDLNQFLPHSSEWVLEQADGINNKGDIVCIGKHAQTSHAFLFAGGTMTDLGSLTDYPNLTEAHLNNQGDVVGQAETVLGTQQCAFLYSHGKLIDLNHAISPTLHWSLEEANGINDSGVIVGTGEWEGKDRAFLITPK